MGEAGENVDIRAAVLLDDPFALPPVTARKAGRPRCACSPRTSYVTLRVLPSEKLRLRAAARRAGYRDASAWARGLLLAACGNDAVRTLGTDARAELGRLRRDLNSGMGANLNQAMMHANALAKVGGVPDHGALADTVRAAEAAVTGLHATLQALLRPDGRP